MFRQQLGANLETDNPALSDDGSDTVAVGGNITSGVDSLGCAGTKDRHCYNVVAP